MGVVQPISQESKYIPRSENALQTIFKDHFEEFKLQYDVKYSATYGKFRIDRITEVVPGRKQSFLHGQATGEDFLKCGDYQEGVARIKCQNPDCGHDHFVPLSQGCMAAQVRSTDQAASVFTSAHPATRKELFFLGNR